MIKTSYTYKLFRRKKDALSFLYKHGGELACVDSMDEDKRWLHSMACQDEGCIPTEYRWSVHMEEQQEDSNDYIVVPIYSEEMNVDGTFDIIGYQKMYIG